MHRKSVISIICLAAAAVILLSNHAQQPVSPYKIEWGYLEKPQLTFGVIPYASDEEIRQDIEPLLNYLEENLERQVALNISSDFHSLESLLELGIIDIAWISQTAFENSKFKNNWEVVCRPVSFGKDYHFSVLVAQKESEINSLEDLKGKRIAYIDRLSDSGFSAPAKLLRKNGIDPIQDFSQAIFTSLSTRSMEMLANKEVDVAAVFADPPEVASAESQLPENLKIIAWSEPVKNSPIIVKKNMEKELSEKIHQLFLKMDTTESGRKALSQLTTADSFKKASN